MAAPQALTPDIVIGAGYIYFDQHDATGQVTGERYIGDTPGFSISMTTEKLEVDSSDGPVAETLVSITKKITRAGSLSLQHVSEENLAIFVMGETATVTQTATPVADEEHVVQQGRYYQLGVSLTNPIGVMGVTAVSVAGSGVTPTYTVTDDYIVDADNGTIYIVPGGAITDDTTIEVDYTPTASTRTRAKTNNSGAVRGTLVFRSDNTVGSNRVVKIPLCELAPQGELPFKSRDASQVLTFDINVLTPEDGSPQIIIDGEAA